MKSNEKILVEMTSVQRNKVSQGTVEQKKPTNQSDIELLYKEGTPNMITSAFVDRPICLLIFFLLVLLAISIISASLGYFELSDSTNRDFLVWDHQKVIDYDMMVAGKEAIQIAAGLTEKPIRMQNADAWNAMVLIKAP